MTDYHAILGLAGTDFSKKDLRRSYARLIKKHRPEDDPEAFQRIHQAYQDALAALAYQDNHAQSSHNTAWPNSIDADDNDDDEGKQERDSLDRQEHPANAPFSSINDADIAEEHSQTASTQEQQAPFAAIDDTHINEQTEATENAHEIWRGLCAAVDSNQHSMHALSIDLLAISAFAKDKATYWSDWEELLLAHWENPTCVQACVQLPATVLVDAIENGCEEIYERILMHIHASQLHEQAIALLNELNTRLLFNEEPQLLSHAERLLSHTALLDADGSQQLLDIIYELYDQADVYVSDILEMKIIAGHEIEEWPYPQRQLLEETSTRQDITKRALKCSPLSELSSAMADMDDETCIRNYILYENPRFGQHINRKDKRDTFISFAVIISVFIFLMYILIKWIS